MLNSSYPHSYPILSHNVPPQVAINQDNLSDLVLFTTFNANEIVDQLRIVLDTNLNSKFTQDKILHEVTSELMKNAWSEKLGRILDSVRLQVATAQQTNSQMDLSVFDELYDIIAFLQILGGLNPEAAQTAGIKHNFLIAFNLMMNMVRKLAPHEQWPELQPNSPCGVQLRQAKSKMFLLCFKTIAELLNSNLPYFDSPESLIRCLNNVIDFFDNNGTFANFFSPPLRQLYDNLQVAVFRSKLSPYQLPAVIRSAARINEDISAEIDLLPNDIRKFQIVSAAAQKDSPFAEKFREVARHCAESSTDVEVILQGMRMFTKDQGCKNHFFNKLSEFMSNWINEFLTHDRPTSDDKVKSAYKPLHKIMEILSENDKHKLFGKVRETELAQALGAHIKRNNIDLKSDDPMVQDLRIILHG